MSVTTRTTTIVVLIILTFFPIVKNHHIISWGSTKTVTTTSSTTVAPCTSGNCADQTIVDTHTRVHHVKPKVAICTSRQVWRHHRCVKR